MGPPAVCLAQWTPGAWAADRLGFTDSVHTRNDGQQQGIVTGTRPADDGLVIGTSERYSGSEFSGLSAWFSTRSTPLQRIGFFDAVHTAQDGRQESVVGRPVALVANADTSINALGQAIGYSTRYLGNAVAGRSAWIWSRASGTVRVGPTAGVFTGPLGEQEATPAGLDNAGRVIGAARRFDTSAVLGQDITPRSAFVWSQASGNTLIGLIDPVHTRLSDGYQWHDARWMNNSGLVAGVSFRFDTSDPNDPGQSAWAWTAQDGTRRIGLRDEPRYVSPEGLQYAYVVRPTEGGALAGASWTFDRDWPGVGRDAWVLPTLNGPTIRLGFTDQVHTGLGGIQRSEPTAIQRSGPLRVAGYSSLFNQEFGFPSGRTAWSWTPGEGLIEIGMRDAEHTSANGDRDNVPFLILASGAVVGFAERFSGTSSRTGQSMWVWTPPTPAEPQGRTTRLGLSDAIHTAVDGFQRSEVFGATRSGFIYGVSYRYNGRADTDPGTGRTAWVFDVSSGVQTALVFETSSTGDAVTLPLSASEAGVVTGNYYEYDGAQIRVPRAFVWSASAGLSTVNALLAGGPAANGMENAFFTESFDDATESGVVYAMTPGVIWTPNDGRWATGFRLRPATPCERADFNSDGVVDFNDLLAFLNEFNGAAPRADINRDGVVDFNDLLEFLNLANAGC